MDTGIRKNFIAINQAFVCAKCREENPKAKPGYRNHCRNCLYSLHVDLEVPGDRQSQCHGLMQPLSVEISSRKGYVITHLCLVCQKKHRNKNAKDDSIETIITLINAG